MEIENLLKQQEKIEALEYEFNFIDFIFIGNNQIPSTTMIAFQNKFIW